MNIPLQFFSFFFQFWKNPNPLPKDKILDLSKFQLKKLEFVLGRALENIVGKGENAGYQHCLLFPQCFQKLSFPEMLSRDCVVKGYLMSFSIDDLTFSDVMSCHICHQGVHKDEPECKAADQQGGDAL